MKAEASAEPKTHAAVRSRLAAAPGIVAIVSFGLFACSETPDAGVAAVAQEPARYAEFNWALQTAYLDLASFSYERGAYAAAKRLAKRARDAEENAPPRLADLPSAEDHRAVTDVAARLDAVFARGGLDQFLRDGAPVRAPGLAADAVAAFDCWVGELHPTGDTDVRDACRRRTEAATESLSAAIRRGGEAPGPTRSLSRTDPSAPALDAPEIAGAARPQAGDYVVFFDYDSWSLTPEAEDNLRNALSTMATRGIDAITLMAHADTIGTARVNRTLSIRRAQAVRRFLKARLGEDLAVDIVALGDAASAVATGDSVEEALNRRVEIKFDL